MITSKTTQIQTFYKNIPINIDGHFQLYQSKNNEPVHICNWAITIWDAAKFAERYKKYGHAVFGNERILFPIDPR